MSAKRVVGMTGTKKKGSQWLPFFDLYGPQCGPSRWKGYS